MAVFLVCQLDVPHVSVQSPIENIFPWIQATKVKLIHDIKESMLRTLFPVANSRHISKAAFIVRDTRALAPAVS